MGTRSTDRRLWHDQDGRLLPYQYSPRTNPTYLEHRDDGMLQLKSGLDEKRLSSDFGKLAF
eukprot:scaffold34637_cov187-Amphora_coffeaeformis.AAC.8